MDGQRKAYYETYAPGKWGRKENYHLCLNTSGREIKTLLPAVETFVQCWFAGQGK